VEHPVYRYTYNTIDIKKENKKISKLLTKSRSVLAYIRGKKKKEKFSRIAKT